MTDVDQLLKATVEELDKLLNPKNVLGEPDRTRWRDRDPDRQLWLRLRRGRR